LQKYCSFIENISGHAALFMELEGDVSVFLIFYFFRFPKKGKPLTICELSDKI